MKKFALVAMAAVAVSAFMTSCGGYSTPNLKTQNDSLNYAYGAANGSGIRQYVLAADTSDASVKEFIDGFEAAFNQKSKSEMYSKGFEVGSNIKQQMSNGLVGDTTITVNEKIIKAALVAMVKGDETLMNGEEAYAFFMEYLNKKQEAEKMSQFGDNKKAGEDFLAENAKRAEVKTTESGLQYEVIKEGKGTMPKATDRVKVNYHGTLIDGTVFDSSVERGTPATFGVNQVIKGWTEALQLMPVGSKWKLYIPQNLAYGSAEQGKIKPFSTLVFEVELLGIEAPAK